MMDSYTGDLTPLKLDDPRIDNPPAGTVILHGTEADIRRVASDVQRRHKADVVKAKRKQQKQSRRRNR